MRANRKARRAARQLFRLCVVDGRLDNGRVRLVAETMVASKRRGALAVLSDLQRMVRLEHERHQALVESAAPLSDDLQSSVRAKLLRQYGASLETSFEQNAALIGGMRIKVGSDVYDGSVRARLAAIEAGL